MNLKGRLVKKIFTSFSVMLLVVGIFLSGKALFQAQSLHSSGSSHPLIALYVHAWNSMQGKIRDLRNLHETNTELRLENAELKFRYEEAQFGCASRFAKDTTQSNEVKLRKGTGSNVGRILGSFSYQVPMHLPTAQLYALGTLYLKNSEDEKAAAIFTTLVEMEEAQEYRTPRNLLATAVSWYRLDNFKLADSYFDEVLKLAEQDEVLPYQAQARLWKALIARHLNKEIKEQFWLNDLVDHHPHAQETAWVNVPDGNREPAED